MTSSGGALTTPPTRGPWSYVWWLVASQRRRVLFGALLGSSWMVSLTLPPYLLSLAIDRGLRPGNSAALGMWVLALLGVGVLNAWLGIMRHRTMTRVRMDAAFRTVTAVNSHAVTLGATLARRVKAGEVVAIGMGDASTIGRSLTITGPGVGAAVAYVVIAVLLLQVSPLLAVVVSLGVPVLAVIVGPALGRLQQAATPYRAGQAALTGRIVDIIAGLGVLNGLGGKDLYRTRYRSESQQLQQQGYRLGAVTSLIQAMGIGLPALFLAVVVWLAARMAADGAITVGQLVAVYGYVAVLAVQVSIFIEGGLDLSHALVAARRVVRFLSIQPPAASTATTVQAPGPAANLHDPTSGVVVEAGRLTAVATARQSEAVALVDRLGGFEAAEATWDGIPLTQIPGAELRTQILVADDDADLFASSLRDVVAGRQQPDDSLVLQSLHLAAADDVVRGLPEGLGSAITAQGRNLSGGQRQRVRLARAVAGDPPVLLAVDPTSAVDAATETTIADRLHTIRQGRTTLVTTTSPLLLDRADTVHFMVNGQVAASGTHAELLQRHPGYRDLVFRGTKPPEGSVQ
ncbi:MAG: Heterodimeric efflux ABC transporter, permease/ATP-binding subunit 1 [uncultured Propionibacteriaceae bacterium]|uniref:Heterodimeric efflux ABC transporter, permease/ATP-binding subunit 1 n=1 Tax=uncultured Propionibacteriaceae bacterium TaxID=257457 RepID=A0A6J4NHI8_9ACTN|nr:MAG: Heterodimeric efflux ABC transporter, permease/ATP-binding subunit 1 [uncultured Propionibacteriaceae bacterium]